MYPNNAKPLLGDLDICASSCRNISKYWCVTNIQRLKKYRIATLNLCLYNPFILNGYEHLCINFELNRVDFKCIEC